MKAKCTWNNAGSSFSFSNDQSSSKKLYYGSLDHRYLAMTYIGGANGYLTSMSTLYSNYFSWSPNGNPGYYDVQNCVTHEFGHWLSLEVICLMVAMLRKRCISAFHRVKRRRDLLNQIISQVSDIFILKR